MSKLVILKYNFVNSLFICRHRALRVKTYRQESGIVLRKRRHTQLLGVVKRYERDI